MLFFNILIKLEYCSCTIVPFVKGTALGIETNRTFLDHNYYNISSVCTVGKESSCPAIAKILKQTGVNIFVHNSPCD